MLDFLLYAFHDSLHQWVAQAAAWASLAQLDVVYHAWCVFPLEGLNIALN